MNLWQSIILGLIEGITEFLPVSSTGHLVLVGKAMGLASTDFVKTFEIAIQSGAMCAVIALYARKAWKNYALAGKVLAAFVPTAVIGLIFYPLVKNVLLGNELVVVWALGIGGIVMIGFEWWYEKSTRKEIFASRHSEQGEESRPLGRSVMPASLDTSFRNASEFGMTREFRNSDSDRVEMISFRQAITIGLFQSLAIVPGVSRAAATIIGGLALGVSRRAIVEFSFLLAVPTILAATALDLMKSASVISGNEWGLLVVGFVISFVSAWAAIRWFLTFISRHTFVMFGAYRIAVGILFFLFL